MLLTRLGVPKLWGNDPERLWPYMRYFATPPAMWLAPSVGYGLDRVPLTGGAVLAANHLSAIDHPIMGALCPRAIHYMAKAELLEIPIVGDVLRWTGAFSVRRGEGDREALRKACAIVREGGVVGVHLEGTRQRFGHPGEFKGGGLLIALRERVPVVPCGLETFRWSFKNRRPCALVWGDPIDVSDLPRNREGLARATARVGEQIVKLWRQAAEAVVARFPPQTPDGARRSSAIPGGWHPGEPFVDDVPEAAR